MVLLGRGNSQKEVGRLELLNDTPNTKNKEKHLPLPLFPILSFTPQNSRTSSLLKITPLVEGEQWYPKKFILDLTSRSMCTS